MVTLSDRAEGHDDGNGGIDYYIAEVLSQQDYYAFGMQMPYRHVTHGSNVYRYGFNGKENDNDVKGEGNQQDYGMRIYDPRLGRFLSVDPLTQEYPWYTPYQFAGNKPIEAIDLDGAEEYYINQQSKILNDFIKFQRFYQKQQMDAFLYRTQPTVLKADIFDNGHIGKMSDVNTKINGIRYDYSVLVGQNIENGPFGATAYLVGGPEASFKGAVADQALGAAVALRSPASPLTREPVTLRKRLFSNLL